MNCHDYGHLKSQAQPQSEHLQHTNCITSYKFKNYTYIKSVNDEELYESSGL